MERIEAYVHGRVQMVMYRDFACRKAKGLGIVGFVQNRRDGTVRIIAEGTHAALEQFIEHLHGGPLLAKVEQVEVVWRSAGNAFTTFDIQYEYD